jgi:hypothetical protein
MSDFQPKEPDASSESFESDSLGKLQGHLKKQSSGMSKRTRIFTCLGLVILLVAGVWFLVTAPDRNYLSDIRAQKLLHYFQNENVALAQGHAYCDTMRGGADAIGFSYQELAVKHFCSEFLTGYKVIPTPEEQQVLLVSKLRSAGLGGSFSSEIDAVNQAHAVCTELDNGGKQQGPLSSFLAVQIYCDKYENGFRTLKEVKVKATFTITEDDPYYSWYPSIYKTSKGTCSGENGYNDIDSSTRVTVTNDDGDVLARTELGDGRGSVYKCVFTYRFTVLEGEKGYNVEVGKRGSLRFTEAQLKIPGELDSGLW